MTKKKKKVAVFEPGDIFLVPLEGSKSYGVGQVVEITKEALNSVICGFYSLQVDKEFKASDAVEKKLIAVQFTSPDLLKEGFWPVVGNVSSIDPNKYMGLDELKKNGYIGAEIEGSAIIRMFLSAYFGLIPWNTYYRDDYFDDMMLNPGNKPSNIFFEEKTEQ